MTDAELFDALVAVMDAMPDRRPVLEWLVQEWGAYAGTKFGDVPQRQAEGHDEDMKENGFGHSSFFVRQITNYWDRSAVFGIADHDPAPAKGRQAAMKTVTTLIDALACMIRVHGLPPAPGHPSGEIEEWQYA